MPLARTSGQHRPRRMQSSRRNSVSMSSKLPARIHHPFHAPKPFPHPHNTIQTPSPHLSSHNLNTEPLLRPRIPSPQPSQPLPRTPYIHNSNSITSPLRNTQVPPTSTPNHLRDPTPSLPLILSPNRKNPHTPTPSKPIIQPHPSRIRPRGQHPLAAHAQRGHYPLHPLTITAPSSSAPPAPHSVHPRHRPLPISINIEQANAALASGEESIPPLRTEQQRMRRYPRFCPRVHERVRCYYLIRCERREESDG